jgi:hypothetical protein
MFLRPCLVVTGVDVEGLYPSLSDIEVVIIVYAAVMNSEIRFEKISYHTAGKYVAKHMTGEEQRRSPLARILPRREARGGVCPGLSTDPRNDENWSFQKAGRTELRKLMLIATAVQIGVIAVMNTHQYSFTGKDFLQKARGPPVLSQEL